jgi:acyl carrier protein
MEMDDVKQKVVEIIDKKLGVEESQVTDEASFTKDLGADSLDTVELIMEFEKEFDITIEDSDAEKIQTVGNVVNYLKEHNK